MSTATKTVQLLKSGRALSKCNPVLISRIMLIRLLFFLQKLLRGNHIDLNSYMNQKMVKSKFKKKKELAEIDNLVNAYNFAQENQLTEENFLEKSTDNRKVIFDKK